MKALTILQPWASAIALGHKRIETRSWATNYRGPLLIHAGANWRSQRGIEGDWRLSGVCATIFKPEPQFDPTDFFDRQSWWLRCGLPYGAIIAVCELVDCSRILVTEHNRRVFLAVRDTVPIALEDERELALGDFTPGRYGWVLANVHALAQPIPCGGKLGLWDYAGELPPEASA